MLRILLGAFFLILTSCGPRVFLKKEITKAERELQEHAGFMLYDLAEKKSIFEYKSARYFTPASNTKIFTFYTGLKLLGDSVPSLKYVATDDSLIFWGLGDPSTLYKNVFQDNRVFSFLKNARQQLYFSTANFDADHFGPGWAWDDYPFSYSAERSPFPLYGNCISAEIATDKLTLFPAHFNKYLITSNTKRQRPDLIRDLWSNQLTYFKSDSVVEDRWEIPFRASSDVVAALLSDTLKREVNRLDRKLPPTAQTLKGIPMDSLYRVMIQDSDNFIAEQILLMSGAAISDTLRSEIAIRFMLQNHLTDLPDEAIWVDGSGLSRYNLFTPRSIVMLWEKVYQMVPRDRLFKLLAVGGRSGTLKNTYKAAEPYIFGKTGTLSNSHSLSGFLLTRKGKTLVFSFMNANYITPTSAVRQKMEKILSAVRDRY